MTKQSEREKKDSQGKDRSELSLLGGHSCRENVTKQAVNVSMMALLTVNSFRLFLHHSVRID